MAKDKKTVVVYTDWISTFEELEDVEAGRLIKHFFRYINDLNPEPPDRITRLLFEPIKQTLKRDLKNYEATCLKNSENAKIRWDKKNANACERIKSDANHADSDNDNDIDSVNDNVNKIKDINIPFDDFWNLYDKKNDRVKCEAKWKRLSDKEREECIAKTPEYIKATPDKKFRKDPATYLNNKSWQNEIIKPNEINTGNNRRSVKRINDYWNTQGSVPSV